MQGVLKELLLPRLHEQETADAVRKSRLKAFVTIRSQKMRINVTPGAEQIQDHRSLDSRELHNLPSVHDTMGNELNKPRGSSASRSYDASRRLHDKQKQVMLQNNIYLVRP